MANRWTDWQLAAITAQNSNVLVSAAAGSGKTAVLVERIIQKVTNTEQPIDIDRLLIVTFTNAAASEMRERIATALAKALEDNPNSEVLARQLVLIHKASITTIHSFCLDMIRTNFNLAGIDPNFRIADPTEDELLRLDALEEVLDEMYEDDVFGESFIMLTDAYSNVKNSSGFTELILKIYHFVMSLPNPKTWLKEAYENFSLPEDQGFDDTFWAKELVQYGKNIILQQLLSYDDIIYKASIDTDTETVESFLAQEKEYVAQLLNTASYTQMRHALQSLSFDALRFKTKGQYQHKEYIQSVRNGIKKKIKEKLAGDLFQMSGDAQKRILNELYPQMHCLSELVSRLIDRFNEKKLTKNLLNFNDLEHVCLSLFRDINGNPTELAQLTAKKFDEILIDEYQDTSKLQESIFSAIINGNSLFMVGDIKQSIYRFRNTDPLLFREKKESFSSDENAEFRKIILSKNFRSRKEVLAGINFIFERIMSKEVGEIDYDHEEMLYPGLEYPDTPNPIPTDTELHIIDLKNEINMEDYESDESVEDEESMETLEKIKAEAILAAMRIQELMEAQYQVFGKNGYKTILFKDICILLRGTKTWAKEFSDVLTSFGIPVFSDVGGGFLASTEIDIMLSLLKIIDNPYQDIPLIAVLRSPLYHLSTNDLVQIRLQLPKASIYEAITSKANETDTLGITANRILNDLNSFREKSKYMKLDELLWDIYMQTGFYEAQGAMPNGLLKQSNMRILTLRARDYEATGFKGLYNFIQFIDNYKSIGGDYEAARLIGEEQDVVRIMSIHKSKGLEFPVVILCGTGNKMNKMDLAKNVLIHPKYGYGPKLVDPQLRVSYNNAMQSSIKMIAEQEAVSEEMRILYVALTRAREKLVVIGSMPNAHKCFGHLVLGLDNDKKIKSFKTITAQSYLDWFVMSLLQHPDCGLLLSNIDYDVPVIHDESRWSIYLHGKNAYYNMEEDEQDIADDETMETDIDVTVLQLVDYAYPWLEDTRLPTKITVTELKRLHTEDEKDEGVFLYPKAGFLSQEKSELAANERGIAFHTVMQYLQLTEDIDLNNIKNQLNVFIQNGYLTEQEAQSIDINKILHFCQSEAGQMMLKADILRREALFAIHVKASQLGLGYQSNSNILLQGIIDCVIEKDGTLTLLDYKTDKVSDINEIVLKYKIQLDYYQIAAEQIYQKKVVKRYLYLFDIDKAIEVS